MKKTKKRTKSIILTIAILAVLGYSCVSFCELQIKIGEADKKCQEILTACEKQELENEELENLLNNGDKAEYIERVARDQLGYVMPDEKVFYDVAGN